MALVMKVLDAIVLGLLVVTAFVVPLFDVQLIFPPYIFPEFLINFKNRLTLELDNMLIEKPDFYLGLAWLQLLFNWPLSIMALYAFVARKAYFNTTCLLLAVSLFTILVSVVGELLGSDRALNKLLLFYFTFLNWSVLALVHGLLLLYCSGLTTVAPSGERHALNQKKRP